MKILVVIGVYLSVSLIVTAGFVLRSNNVMASPQTTVEDSSVAVEQQTTLDDRYQRIGHLASQVIDREVAEALVHEAVGVADYYLTQEIEDPEVRVWLRGVIKEHGLPHLKTVLAEVPAALEIRIDPDVEL
ncbi:MAG: hypothetical protein AAF438_07780 [Pseudomonadota bacterium]